MIKIENVEIMGWEHVIRGMRNLIAVYVKVETMVLGVEIVPLMIANIHMISRGSLEKRIMNWWSDSRKVSPNDYRLYGHHSSFVLVEGVRYL